MKKHLFIDVWYSIAGLWLIVNRIRANRVSRSGTSGAVTPGGDHSVDKGRIYAGFALRNVSALVIFLMLHLCTYASPEHPHSIAGQVLDGGEPLAGVTVILEPGGIGRITDAEGRFTFGIQAEGNYKLILKCPAYHSDTIEVQVKGGQTLQICKTLEPAPVQLNQVEIVAGGTAGQEAVMRMDVRLNPVFSAQEMLRKIPGLFIGQHAGGGKAEQMFLRGYDLDHGTDFSISVDGMPVNMVSHAHGQGYADLHFLIPELIDNISYELGPYDVTKGNLSTAGSANFQTKQFLKENFIKMEGGSFGTFRSLAMLRLLGDAEGYSKQQAFIAGEQVYSRGYFESPQDFNRLNLFGKYRVRIGASHLLTATASTFSSNWNASGQVPDRAVASGLISPFGAIDDNEGGSTARSNVLLSLKSILHDGSVISQQAFISDYSFLLYSNFTFFAQDSVNGDQIRQRERRKLTGYNVHYNRVGSLLGKSFRLQAGTGFRADFIKELELSRTMMRNVTLTPVQFGRVAELNAGSYAEGSWDVHRRIQIKAGARLDYFRFTYLNQMLDSDGNWLSKDKSVINPKVQFHYSINEHARLYIKAGSGFHSNDSRTATEPAAPAQLPRAWAADAGLILKPGKNLYIQSGVWAMSSVSEFVYVGDEGIVEEAGPSRRLGADIVLRWQPCTWLFADVNANATLPRLADVPSGENYIPLAPLLSSSGGITITPFSRIAAGVKYRYLADRPANESFSLTAKGYFLADAQLSYSTGYFEFGVSVINFMNTFWKEAQFETTSQLRGEANPVTEIHFTPGSPRNIQFSAGVKF